MFRTGFINQRLFKVANSFYSALEEKIHFYIPPDKRDYTAHNFSNLTNFQTLQTKNCSLDGDFDETLPLHIAFDSNAAISTCCVGQIDGKQMKPLKSFFVKTPLKLDSVVQEFRDYYEPSTLREVVFYYGHTFVWTTGNNAESYRDTIIRKLQQNGWEVE